MKCLNVSNSLRNSSHEIDVRAAVSGSASVVARRTDATNVHPMIEVLTSHPLHFGTLAAALINLQQQHRKIIECTFRRNMFPSHRSKLIAKPAAVLGSGHNNQCTDFFGRGRMAQPVAPFAKAGDFYRTNTSAPFPPSLHFLVKGSRTM